MSTGSGSDGPALPATLGSAAASGPAKGRTGHGDRCANALETDGPGGEPELVPPVVGRPPEEGRRRSGELDELAQRVREPALLGLFRPAVEGEALDESIDG